MMIAFSNYTITTTAAEQLANWLQATTTVNVLL